MFPNGNVPRVEQTLTFFAVARDCRPRGDRCGLALDPQGSAGAAFGEAGLAGEFDPGRDGAGEVDGGAVDTDGAACGCW